MNGTATTHIVIDTQGSPEYLQLILDTLPYMNKWITHANIDAGDMCFKGARFFAFDFEQRMFSWSHFSNSPPAEYTVIRDTAQLSELLEFVNSIGDAFVMCPTLYIKMPLPVEHINIDMSFSKTKEMDNVISFNKNSDTLPKKLNMEHLAKILTQWEQKKHSTGFVMAKSPYPAVKHPLINWGDYPYKVKLGGVAEKAILKALKKEI